MTAKLSPLALINYSIRSLRAAEAHTTTASGQLPKKNKLPNALSQIAKALRILEGESNKLAAVRRSRTFRVRDLNYSQVTLDEALDSIGVTSDPLRTQYRTIIEVVMIHFGIDYTGVRSGRRVGRIAQAKKTLAIILKKYFKVSARDTGKLLGVDLNTVDYHVRTAISQDTILFMEIIQRIKDGTYYNEH